MAKKKERTRQELRSLHTQQVISVIIGVIVILAMVLQLVSK